MGRPNPKPPPPPVVSVGVVAVLIFFIASVSSETWSDIICEALVQWWGLAGYTVLFLSSISVTIIEHRRKRKPWAELWPNTWAYIHAPVFYAICAFLLFLGTIDYTVHKKFGQLDNIVKTEQTLSVDTRRESSRLRQGWQQDSSYRELTNQLAETKREVVSQTERGNLYRDYYLTNSEQQSSDLDAVIAIASRWKSQSVASNSEAALQAERDMALLTRAKYKAQAVNQIVTTYPIWNHAVIEFQRMISERARKCGSEVEPIKLPTPDELADNKEVSKSIMVGTNCAWQAGYRVTREGLSLNVKGKDGKKVEAWFGRSSAGLRTYLTISGEETLRQPVIPLVEMTNCMYRVRYMLDLLIESRKMEFQ